MIDFFDDKPSSVYQKTFESYIEEEKSKEICQICSKTFANKHTLITHASQEHVTIEKKTCRFCSYVFSSKNNLKRHMKSKHDSNAPNEANFGPHRIILEDSHEFKTPQNKVNPQKHFSCDICEISFSLKHNFDRHKSGKQ